MLNEERLAELREDWKIIGPGQFLEEMADTIEALWKENKRLEALVASYGRDREVLAERIENLEAVAEVAMDGRNDQ